MIWIKEILTEQLDLVILLFSSECNYVDIIRIIIYLMIKYDFEYCKSTGLDLYKSNS